MQKITLDKPITFQGMSVRTTNADEMTAGNENSTAKIGDLWQNFYGQFADSLDDNSQIFGIYHNYESDVNGAFDVTACFANDKELKDNLDTIIIPTGKYLVFKKQGAMPQAVIEAWDEVWNYFNSDGCTDKQDSYRRSYQVDFEKYIGADIVEVYIGVE